MLLVLVSIVFRKSCVGHLVAFVDTKGLVDKCATKSFPCMSVVDVTENKLFLVRSGTVELCVRPDTSTSNSHSVGVSTLVNSCRTLQPGDLYLSFGNAPAEVSFVSSDTAGSKLVLLNKHHLTGLTNQSPFKKLGDFSDLK